MKIVNEKSLSLCGIDEAGRGPLAGMLVICGVVLGANIDGLADSKKLSEKKREYLYEQIIASAEYHIVSFDAPQIDKLGISECLRRGLEEIKDALSDCKYLFDGNCTFGVSDISTMVKADTKIAEVSAASILAKVTRDRDINHMDTIYPEYGFLSHKGYGTAKHIKAILEFGRTPIHRKSFRVKGLI
jgi:ribonuclease HII